MKSFVAALGFLTRVPVPAAAVAPSASLGWMALVGALIGAVVAGVYALTSLLLPLGPSAALALLSGVLLTGGLHEDGLGDTADALGGPAEPERALAILKDPRLGTFGVLAISFSLLLRVGAIASMDRYSAVAMLVCAHALARAIPVALMASFPVAAPGLGSTYSSGISVRVVWLSLGSGLVIGTVAAGVWGIVALVVGFLPAATMARTAARRLGGITGDVLGAAEQVAETAILLLGSAVVSNAWIAPAWWR